VLANRRSEERLSRRQPWKQADFRSHERNFANNIGRGIDHGVLGVNLEGWGRLVSSRINLHPSPPFSPQFFYLFLLDSVAKKKFLIWKKYWGGGAFAPHCPLQFTPMVVWAASGDGFMANERLVIKQDQRIAAP
jgi:hypothetical protein